MDGIFSGLGDAVKRLDTSTVALIPSVGITPVVRQYFPETWIWDCKTVRFVAICMHGLRCLTKQSETIVS